MSPVTVTREAKEVIERAFDSFDFSRPGFLIPRQASRTDVLRTATGEARWAVGRLHPWKYTVSSMSAIPDKDIVMVEGIPFWLAIIPRPEESGIVISVRNGELYIDALP